jgi:hypothetical protein
VSGRHILSTSDSVTCCFVAGSSLQPWAFCLAVLPRDVAEAFASQSTSHRCLQHWCIKHLTDDMHADCVRGVHSAGNLISSEIEESTCLRASSSCPWVACTLLLCAAGTLSGCHTCTHCVIVCSLWFTEWVVDGHGWLAFVHGPVQLTVT